MTAGQATQLLGPVTTSDALAAACRELAAQFTADLRGIDAQMRDIKKKLTVAVRAARHDPAVRAPVPGDVPRCHAGPAQRRYVLVWFTKLQLGPAGTYEAEIYGIGVKGQP